MKDGKSGAVKEGGDSEPESQVTVVVEGAPGVKTRAVAEATSLKEAAVQARASSADRQTGTASMWGAAIGPIILAVVGAVVCIALALESLYVGPVIYASVQTSLAIDEAHEDVMGMRVAQGLMTVGLGSVLVELCLFLTLALIAGVVAVLLMVYAGVKWQDIEDYFSEPANEALTQVGLIFAILFLCLFLAGNVVWLVTDRYLTLVYCAQEALGKGDEHVTGMYAVYALLTLGWSLGELAFAYMVVAIVGWAVLLSLEHYAGAKWRPGGVVDRARHFFSSLALPLFCSTAGVFLSALVVWAGTGAYLGFNYCAKEAWGRGGEHVKSMYAVYALLALGLPLAWLSLVYIVVCIVMEVTKNTLEEYTRAGRQWRSEGVAERERHFFFSLRHFIFSLAFPLLYSTACVFLAALVVWAGTGAYLGFSYCAKEALGRGGEHVKAMYAVYALLTLGLPLAWLALAYIVVFIVVGAALVALEEYAGRRWRPEGVAERAGHWFVSLAPPLFLSTACVFLAALVVWAGTGVYSAAGYCAKEALGRGGEHMKAMYAVYALLALGVPIGGLLLACFVVLVVVTSMMQTLEEFVGQTWRQHWQSEGVIAVALKARTFFKYLAAALFLFAAGIFLAALVLWLGTGIYVAFSYCANEAVGHGGEHVQGIYALYALLALGIVMGVCALVYLVAYVVADAIAPAVSTPAGEKSRPEPQGIAAKARSLFGALASTLLMSTAGVFLAALVVWAGTGIYLLVSGRAH